MTLEDARQLTFLVFDVLILFTIGFVVFAGIWELRHWLRRTPMPAEFLPGSFSMRRGSALRQHHARELEVAVKDRWYTHAKWAPKE